MSGEFTQLAGTTIAGSDLNLQSTGSFVSKSSIGINSLGGGSRVTSNGSVGGQQYTSSETIGGSSMFGGAVKDSLRKFLERRDQRIIDLSLAPGEENTSQLCWGGLNPNNPRVGFKTSFKTVDKSDKNNQPKQPDDKLYEWREQERFVVKTKITNPEDKEQYIWVDVVKVMVVTAPSQEPFNGKTHMFRFEGKRTQIGVDEGGDSEDADDSDDEESSGSPTPGPSGKSPGTGTTGPSGLGGSQPSGFGGG